MSCLSKRAVIIEFDDSEDLPGESDLIWALHWFGEEKIAKSVDQGNQLRHLEPHFSGLRFCTLDPSIRRSVFCKTPLYSNILKAYCQLRYYRRPFPKTKLS